VLPEGALAVVDADEWPLPPLFAFLQSGGAIEPGELARTFNCGIGMVAIVRIDDAAEVTERLEHAGERVFHIGAVEAGEKGCTVRGESGSWSARADWSVTHNG
jgi:phosphoribosylformylglycinamidine cyclo-ligase